MPGVDITGYKSLSQHSEAPASRQRENKKERGGENKGSSERKTLEKIRSCSTVLNTSRAGMKCSSIRRINASAQHHPPPLWRHRHHFLRYYQCRCNADGRGMRTFLLGGGRRGHKYKMLSVDLETCEERIIRFEVLSCKQKNELIPRGGGSDHREEERKGRGGRGD